MSIEPTTPNLDVLVDLKTVCRSLCRSRASIYRDIERGAFPKPVKLGIRRVGGRLISGQSSAARARLEGEQAPLQSRGQPEAKPHRVAQDF